MFGYSISHGLPSQALTLLTLGLADLSPTSNVPTVPRTITHTEALRNAYALRIQISES